ncbi:hypothetical protein Q1695_005031 [Nippostrongylus brasiliensis]|nr:hypothetical protein Q1695_005031 [Nippostrongylus brasiliensis]
MCCSGQLRHRWGGVVHINQLEAAYSADIGLICLIGLTVVVQFQLSSTSSSSSTRLMKHTVESARVLGTSSDNLLKKHDYIMEKLESKDNVLITLLTDAWNFYGGFRFAFKRRAKKILSTLSAESREDVQIRLLPLKSVQ